MFMCFLFIGFFAPKSMGARFLSSIGLGLRNLVGRAQLLPVPALQKLGSLFSRSPHFLVGRSAKKILQENYRQNPTNIYKTRIFDTFLQGGQALEKIGLPCL